MVKPMVSLLLGLVRQIKLPHYHKQFQHFVWTLFIISNSLLIASCGGGKGSGSPVAEGNAILPSAAKLDPPGLTSPPTNTHPSNTTNLAIAGTCTYGPGAKVFLGGDDDQKTTCSIDGNFSFNSLKSNDGIFNYTLREESLIHHPSDNTTLTWLRSSTPPAAPSITAPSSYPYLSATNILTISGACVTGYTVNLTGDSTQSVICNSNNTYSFIVNKSVDGTYVFELYQTDIYGNRSASIQTSWNRDTAVPVTPTILTPIANPYTSDDSLLTLTGNCGNGTTVKLYKSINASDQLIETSACSNSLFLFELNESTDNTYNYSLIAFSATNIASTSRSFQWTRSSSVPPTPILSTPATSPIASNANSITIAGSCVDGNTVYLNGSATDNILCVASSFTFTITKNSDATYTFSVYQQLGSTQSGAVGVVWVRDSLAPSAPILTVPGISPYYSSASILTISGICDNGASVNLSGDINDMVNCSNSKFTFNVLKTTSATYNFSVSQTDAASNTSLLSTQQWVLDTFAPSSPTITSPASSPSISNANTITIAGACENSALVYLTGASTQNINCGSNTYSFTISKTVDGDYNFSVSQTDLAGLSSPSSSVNWIRDTTAPSTPTINNPVANPLTSNDTNLAIAGSCETGATIHYSGAASGTSACTSGAYSFTVSKLIDDTYSFIISQTDSANNTSTTTSLEWTRLSSIPTTPTIITPSTNPYYGKLNTLTLSGACTTGNTVQLSGADSQTNLCANNAFSFALSQNLDGSYTYNIIQVNAAGLTSSTTSFTWIIDTVVPIHPVISSPSTTSVTNTANTLTVIGTCETNATIQYGGSASGTSTCNSNGAFSIIFSNSIDGIYNYTISQIDRAGNISGATSVTWKRDTLAPATPSLTQPNMNPFISGDTNLTITGNCEVEGTVTLVGTTTQNILCTALGTYSFNISKTIDGTYNYTITQTDLAGNVSSALAFQWERDTSIPFTPIITNPAIANYTSNSSTVSISVTCQTDLTPQSSIVHLTGVLASEVITPANTLDQDCITSPVTYIIQKNTDAVYAFTFNQENPNNTNISADIVFTWTRDTIAPSTPTVSSPSVNPYTGPGNLTLAGACEANAILNLTGDATQNVACADGTFSFSLIKSNDATYNFNLTQTDLAGNTSLATTQTWTRNSNSLPPPIITSPATNPITNNNSTITLSGTCEPGYTVTLGGNVSASDVTNPTNSLSQTCSAAGDFTFSLAKTNDGVYTFSLTESFSDATSAATNFTWTRDTTAPATIITTTATNPNLNTAITFSFAANEASSYQCKLASGAYQSCTSPATYSGLTNGTLSFYVIATDSVGNIGTPANYTWTQSAYNAVAIYHMAAGTGSALTDSGLFTANGVVTNNLTAYGSPTTNSSGKLPTASPTSFNLGTNKYFSLANNVSTNSTADKMTIEGFYYFSSLTGTAGNYYTLISNTGSASPNLGWELRLEKSSGSCSKFKLKFIGSLNGTSQTTVTSTSCITVSTSRWYYVALTWNKGTVNFYLSSSGATSRGSGVIGTAGASTLWTPNVPLKLGANATTGTGSSLWLTGSIDEIRISNTVRTPSFPASEFTAD